MLFGYFAIRPTWPLRPICGQSIEAALNGSEWLVLLASPESARSTWVQREVDWWLTNRSADRLIVVLTAGEVAWDATTGQVDTECATAIERPAGQGQQQVGAADDLPQVRVLADDQDDGQGPDEDGGLDRGVPPPWCGRGQSLQLCEREMVPALRQVTEYAFDVGGDTDEGEGVAAEVDEARVAGQRLSGECGGEDVADRLRALVAPRGEPAAGAADPPACTTGSLGEPSDGGVVELAVGAAGELVDLDRGDRGGGQAAGGA